MDGHLKNNESKFSNNCLVDATIKQDRNNGTKTDTKILQILRGLRTSDKTGNQPHSPSLANVNHRGDMVHFLDNCSNEHR